MSEPYSSSPSLGPSGIVNRSGTALFSAAPTELLRFFPLGYSTTETVGDIRLTASYANEEEWHRQIEDLQPDVIVSGWSTPPIPARYCAIHGGPIRYVCNATGSIRHIVTRDMIEAGLWVTNWGSLVAPMVAEHALALTLSCLRNQSRWPEVMNGSESIHKSKLETRTLYKKRVALHGAGAISRALVKLLRVFDCDVVAYSQGMPEGFASSMKIEVASQLSALCRDADVLICCEALTPSTLGELNYTTLSQLKQGAAFINIGRGAVVEEIDLLRAALELQLRVGLDVFCEEPLPIDSPLRSIPGIIISPHIAGPTHDAFAECGDHALANLDRYRAGKKPTDLITVAMFDRAS